MRGLPGRSDSNLSCLSLISQVLSPAVRPRASKVAYLLFQKVCLRQKIKSQFLSRIQTIKRVIIRFKRHMEARSKFVKDFKKKWNNYLTEKIQEDLRTSSYSKFTRLFVNTPTAVVERLAWLFFDKAIQANTIRVMPTRRDWFTPYFARELAAQRPSLFMSDGSDSPKKDQRQDLVNVSLLNNSFNLRPKISRKQTKMLDTSPQPLILASETDQPNNILQNNTVVSKQKSNIRNSTSNRKIVSKRQLTSKKQPNQPATVSRFVGRSAGIIRQPTAGIIRQETQASDPDLSAFDTAGISSRRRDERTYLSRADSLSKVDSPRSKSSLQRQGSISKEKTKKKPKKFVLGLIGSGVDDYPDVITPKMRFARCLAVVKAACRWFLIVERNKYPKKWIARKLQKKPSQMLSVLCDLKESDLELCVSLLNKHNSANFLQYKGTLELDKSLS